ncbi:MAG: hypothetical protein Q9181_001741 [Wetmoreana brouardii]
MAPSLPPPEPTTTRLLSVPLHEGQSKENIFAGSPHGAPNHCLINEYTPGQGIHPHEDGAAYYPVVCTISLGSPIVLDVYRKGESKKPAYRILQEQGSLLISMEEMYTDYLHGIKEVEVDEELHGGEGGVCNWEMLGKEWRARIEDNGGKWGREIRVSATFRDVMSVKKVGKGLGFLSAGGKN